MIRRPIRFKEYYNIIILILILGILFFFGRMLLSKNSFAETTTVNTTSTQREAMEALPSENKFLVQAIHQVFPVREVKRKISIEDCMNKLYTYLIYNTLKVDFRNPVTFVQNQFPATLSYNIEVTEPIEENLPKNPESNERDIHFVEIDGKDEYLATGTIPRTEDVEEMTIEEKDDLGESWQGIYLVGEDDIIDSLDSNNSFSTENVKLPQKVDFQEGKPHILIYHTHGTESYQPASEGNYHSLRKEYTVIQVGKILKEELEKKGFNVIHDITYHDYPSYSGSYTRSLTTAQKILRDHPSIKVVFDIHRDGYDNIEENTTKNSLVANNRVTIGNEITTRFQMVIGPETQNRQEIETFANFIKAVSDSKYPGFSKPVLLKPYGKYNQFLTNHYALLEVGSNVNTIEEAKKAAYYLADVLSEALKQIKK